MRTKAYVITSPNRGGDSNEGYGVLLSDISSAREALDRIRGWRPEAGIREVSIDYDTRICRDGGTCHHECGTGNCYREDHCGALTGDSGLNENWSEKGTIII